MMSLLIYVKNPCDVTLTLWLYLVPPEMQLEFPVTIFKSFKLMNEINFALIC